MKKIASMADIVGKKFVFAKELDHDTKWIAMHFEDDLVLVVQVAAGLDGFGDSPTWRLWSQQRDPERQSPRVLELLGICSEEEAQELLRRQAQSAAARKENAERAELKRLKKIYETEPEEKE